MMPKKQNYRAQKGRSPGRHPSDAFPVEKDALAAAVVRTAVLMQGDQTDPAIAERVAVARAELDFAHRLLVAKVAQIAPSGRG